MGGGRGSFSHKAPTLSTDLMCYFGCPEGFKKDFDLRLHLKLRHKDEHPDELVKAYQACEEEIALVKRSCSLFQCALCPKQLTEVGSFYDHIRKTHNLEWLDYREQYGRCEIESAPFECKICGRVVKYNRDSIDGHLKYVHSINWVSYLERIRKMRRGERPAELPSIEFFECKICGVSVKYIWRKDHLKRVHKITEPEYIELYKDDNNQNDGNQNNNIMSPEFKPNDMNNPTPQMEMQPIMTQPMGNFQPNGYDQGLQEQKFQPNGYDQGIQEQKFQPNGYDQGMQEQKFQPNGEIHYQNNENQVGDSKPPQMYAINSIPPSNYFSRPIPTPDLATSNSMQTLPKPPKSDIQNVKNKICSSCDMKFETRRLFIEHCTMVHKMKFKTASGVTIAAPKSLGNGGPPLEQDTINRPIVNDNQGQFNAPFDRQNTYAENNPDNVGSQMGRAEFGNEESGREF